MYFALVPYLKDFNELTFQENSIEDEETLDQSVTVLPVVYLSQEFCDATRSTYAMKMHIKMQQIQWVKMFPFMWISLETLMRQCPLAGVQVVHSKTFKLMIMIQLVIMLILVH